MQPSIKVHAIVDGVMRCEETLQAHQAGLDDERNSNSVTCSSSDSDLGHDHAEVGIALIEVAATLQQGKVLSCDV